MLSFLFSNPFRGWRTWPWRTNLIALAGVAAAAAALLLYGVIAVVIAGP